MQRNARVPESSVDSQRGTWSHRVIIFFSRRRQKASREVLHDACTHWQIASPFTFFFYVYIAVPCLGCLGKGLFAGSLHIALLCPMEKRSIISPHPNPPECRQSTLFLMFDVHTSVTLWVETEARGGDQYWLELVLSGPANLRTIVRGHTIVASDTQLRVS